MIHVVVGPPCGGKSTFVETNAPAGVPRFDFDRVAETLGGGEFNYEPPAEVIDATLSARRGVMGWLLDDETRISEFWLINAAPSPSTINRLAAAGAVFHLIDPGVDECIARAQRDGRPPETIARIRAWYENPPELPGADSKKGAPVVVLKNFDAEVAAAAPDGENEASGQIVAYASVFDNVDSYGDVIRRGAFADTLKEWRESGKSIPLLYGHNFADPFMNIGGVVDAVEDSHGLKITASLDMDNPAAAQVHRLVKAGRLSEMSFAFNYRDAGPATVDGEEVFEVRSLELFEVSIVPIGANRETEILDVKSAGRLLTAAKQANLAPGTLDAIVELVLSDCAKSADVPAVSNAETSPATDGGADSLAVSRALEARLLLSERLM